MDKQLKIWGGGGFKLIYAIPSNFAILSVGFLAIE